MHLREQLTSGRTGQPNGVDTLPLSPGAGKTLEEIIYDLRFLIFDSGFAGSEC
jgi:hypothetical protein